MFPPAPVLVFTEEHQLVATGSVLGSNPDRIIVKKIVLSGHPFKINKKSSVVRYMFFNRGEFDHRTSWNCCFGWVPCFFNFARKHVKIVFLFVCWRRLWDWNAIFSRIKLTYSLSRDEVNNSFHNNIDAKQLITRGRTKCHDISQAFEEAWEKDLGWLYFSFIWYYCFYFQRIFCGLNLLNYLQNTEGEDILKSR